MGEDDNQHPQADRPDILRRQYRALLQSAPDPTFVADAETGEIIEVNEAAVEFRGEPREDILGLHQSDLHPDGEAARYQRLFEVHLAEEGKRQFTPDGSRIYAVDAEGREIPVEITATVIDLPDGPIIYGTFQDISDRLERQRELRRFEQAVESAGSAIFFTDRSGEIEHVNPATEEITGYDAPELIGETPSILDAGEMPEGYFAELWTALLNGETWEEEIVNRRNNGELYTALQTISPITVDGGIEGFVAIQTDITERKRQEEELRRQNERLEDFASVVSHDLRNPLNVAQGRVDLARETRDSEHLDAASEGIERSLDLLEDLLALARSGQTVSEMERVDLDAAIDNCWAAIETTDASVVSDVAATIRADRTRLRQLLENLFRNAVEHGGEDVTIRVGTLEEEGVYVADDGPGIPEDKREDVFEQGVSASADGTGFGLAIVEQVVEAHGWDVGVTDAADGGARFEIRGVEFGPE